MIQLIRDSGFVTMAYENFPLHDWVVYFGLVLLGPSNNGKWRFILGFRTTNVIIL